MKIYVYVSVFENKHLIIEEKPYDKLVWRLVLHYLSFSDIMDISPTLNVWTAQTIVNNNILTDEIPLQLHEEMHTLKKVKQFQQDIKYEKRKYKLLQNII